MTEEESYPLIPRSRNTIPGQKKDSTIDTWIFLEEFRKKRNNQYSSPLFCNKMVTFFKNGWFNSFNHWFVPASRNAQIAFSVYVPLSSTSFQASSKAVCMSPPQYSPFLMAPNLTFSARPSPAGKPEEETEPTGGGAGLSLCGLSQGLRSSDGRQPHPTVRLPVSAGEMATRPLDSKQVWCVLPLGNPGDLTVLRLHVLVSPTPVYFGAVKTRRELPPRTFLLTATVTT